MYACGGGHAIQALKWGPICQLTVTGRFCSTTLELSRDSPVENERDGLFTSKNIS